VGQLEFDRRLVDRLERLYAARRRVNPLLARRTPQEGAPARAVRSASAGLWERQPYCPRQRHRSAGGAGRRYCPGVAYRVRGSRLPIVRHPRQPVTVRNRDGPGRVTPRHQGAGALEHLLTTLPAGDPAALEQAFVVLTAIIGLLTAGVRGQPAPGASGVRNVTSSSGCRPRIAILCHEKIICRFVRRIRNLF
jgi:hypothetical protein